MSKCFCISSIHLYNKQSFTKQFYPMIPVKAFKKLCNSGLVNTVWLGAVVCVTSLLLVSQGPFSWMGKCLVFSL